MVTALMDAQQADSASPSSNVSGLRRRSSLGRGPPNRGPWLKRDTDAVSAPKLVMVSTTDWLNPVSSAATSMSTPTPMTTPSMVRKLRSLWLSRVSSASRRFSRYSCATVSFCPCETSEPNAKRARVYRAGALGLRAERLNRVEPRGSHRRINPKKKAYRGGDGESGDYRAHGCLDRHGRGGAHHRDNRHRHAHTDEAAVGRWKRLC